MLKKKKKVPELPEGSQLKNPTDFKDGHCKCGSSRTATNNEEKLLSAFNTIFR